MKIVVDLEKLEPEFVEGFLVKAANHARSSPFWGVFNAIAQVLKKQQARWNARPRRLAAKSLRCPFEDLSSGNLLAFQVEMAGVQFIVANKDFPHGAAFCQALGLAAAEQIFALGEAAERRRLN